MASRRSRLQVKPNVGIRGAATGPKKEDVKKAVVDIREESLQQSTVKQKDTNQLVTDTDNEKAVVIKPNAGNRRSRIKPQVKIRPGKTGSSTGSAPLVQHHFVVRERNLSTSEESFDVNSAAKLGQNLDNSLPCETDLDGHEHTKLEEDHHHHDGLDEPDSVCKPTEGDDSIKHEAVPSSDKSTPKRGRFSKARPNIAETERRRTREKQPDDGASAAEIVLTEIADERSSGHDTGGKETSHENTDKQTTKAKRRQPVKLNTLVSENRSSFTIGDLIHMNPAVNPMKRYTASGKNSSKDSDASQTGIKDQDVSLVDGKDVNSCLDESNDVTKVDPNQPIICQETVDESRGADEVVCLDAGDVASNPDKEMEVKEDEANPVPQVMIGPDGCIILNETSLVIKNPATQASPAAVEGDIIVENDNYDPSFYYKKKTRGLTWNVKDTTKFFVALSTVGTDFSLMCNLFPKRSRTELKRKFKIEERKHKYLVDRALRERRELDLSVFDNTSEDEDVWKNEETNSTKDGVPDENTGIKQTVAMHLENEKKQSKKGKKTVPKTTQDKAGKQETKQNVKKKRGRNRYYDVASEESDQEDFARFCEKQDAIGSDEEKKDEEIGSGDETEVLTRVMATKTRSGRQPKRSRNCTTAEDRGMTMRKSRQQANINTNQENILKSPQRSPGTFSKMSPYLTIPPSGVPQKLIEDTSTGQRLLLVKSPPPPGAESRDPTSEFLHVYLLSPPQRRQTENSDTDGETSKPSLSVPETDDNKHVEILSPECHFKVDPDGLVPDQLEVVDMHHDSADIWVKSESVDRPDCTEVVCEIDDDRQVHVIDTSQFDSETATTFENFAVTVTEDQGQIVEILIDPGEMTQEEKYQPV